MGTTYITIENEKVSQKNGKPNKKKKKCFYYIFPIQNILKIIFHLYNWRMFIEV